MRTLGTLIQALNLSSHVLDHTSFLGAMGKRAQKILEMGLAKAAERSKQRQSLPALAKSSTATSPAPVPDDQPGSRPGILRNLTTPRPRTRVSFASQPVVFILNSPSKPSPDEGSQTTNPTKPVSPPSANAHVSASSEANKVKSVVDNQSQGLLQAEFSSPSIEVTPPSHNESGVSPLKSAVIQPALPEEIAMPFSTTANDISKSSSSPPFLPIGSRRRRKSASPRRRDPIDRSSRDALRHSLPNGIAGSFVRPLNCRHPFASVDNDTIAVQEKATMADKNNVDLDSTNAEDLAQSSITMSTKESNADKSQHSTTSETTLLESSQSFDFVATTQEEVEDSVLKSMSTTSVAFDHVKAKAQEVSELESAAATGHNDFVGSSQELNSVDEVLVADTEPEQIANQPMCDSMDTTLAAVDTQEILSNKHGAEEKSTQPKMVELARQTLTTLKSQLSALTTEQKKELLFETLALFKSIIP
uniref:BRCT domain-containing protein n=1 Tax=Mesocestoides corti TaxID=53468 RepID=A0A5K3FHP1_MESCO